MPIETTQPRSRRAIMASGIGGLAALVAAALGRPEPVQAGTDGDVWLGHANSASSVTSITVGGTDAFLGRSAGASTSGVWGDNTNGGYGVAGSTFGSTTAGVWGSNYGAGAGVRGSSESASGVVGFSGDAAGFQPAAPAKTGVYGYAVQDTGAIGVKGQSTVGTGVQGIATSGIGSRGAGTTGYGVYATATTGTAIIAKTDTPKSGIALRTIGKVKFDNSVGIATVAAGTSSITVTPGIDLSTTSAVVATLQANPTGTLTVKGVVVNATADTFTIYLTANAAAAVKVAWHVFG